MTADFLILPCLFITLYFEAFLLVTFLSGPAEKSRKRAPLVSTPSVAMIVPCHNEEGTIVGTVASLLALDYPADKLSVVLVDDGSTDGTSRAMETFKENPRISILRQEQGGKHTALNAGIAIAHDADIIGCMDADSFVAPDALREMLHCFEDERVAATTAAMSVFRPRTLVEKMQHAEYILGIALRHILASVNGLYVTPGPFSLYRTSSLRAVGAFRRGHQTEDMEMALRLQRAGFRIENAPRARVYTTVPSTVPSLIRQRMRWTSGFLRNALYEYRDLIGNPRHGALGLLVLPMGLFAIMTTIALFSVSVFESVRQLIELYLITNGVPLSHLFVLRPFEWFYLPFTTIVVLTIIVLSVVVLLAGMGKRISGISEPVGAHLFLYTFIYGFIVPVWTVRAVTDVAFGAERAWKRST